MVTASELNQLNVWNDKIEESTSCPESYIPDSIIWMFGLSKFATQTICRQQQTLEINDYIIYLKSRKYFQRSSTK